jgi:uncharacterized protein
MSVAAELVDDHARARAAYLNGRFTDAYQIWRIGAEAGDAEAQCWLGSLYANGEGVSVDDARALHWYIAAAKQGNHMAQANAGAFLFMGRGTAKNAKEAVKWLTEAANGADLNGLFNLAVLYAKGDGVPVDQEKAASLYRHAAELGHYPSQTRLGHIYAHGQGVPKDRVQAYLWLSLAAQHGIGTALNALESIVNDMSAEEKAKGIALFEDWRGRTKARNGQVALHPMPS